MTDGDESGVLVSFVWFPLEIRNFLWEEESRGLEFGSARDSGVQEQVANGGITGVTKPSEATRPAKLSTRNQESHNSNIPKHHRQKSLSSFQILSRDFLIFLHHYSLSIQLFVSYSFPDHLETSSIPPLFFPSLFSSIFPLILTRIGYRMQV